MDFEHGYFFTIDEYGNEQEISEEEKQEILDFLNSLDKEKEQSE